MEFRRANTNDIESLVNMRIAYLKDDYGTLSEEQIIRLKEQLPIYFNSHVDKDLKAYIAVQEKEVVSVILMLIVEKPANPSFITGKTGTLLSVYTKPEFRRKGIANKLLNMVIEDAKSMDLSFIDLHATKDGYPLYLKNGFVEEKSEYVPMKYKIK